jgi:hypothetical protein
VKLTKTPIFAKWPTAIFFLYYCQLYRSGIEVLKNCTAFFVRGKSETIERKFKTEKSGLNAVTIASLQVKLCNFSKLQFLNDIIDSSIKKIWQLAILQKLAFWSISPFKIFKIAQLFLSKFLP